MDKRLLRSSKSINNLNALLLEAFENPRLFYDDKIFCECTKSQEKIAKYSHPDREIIPTSVNTIKRISNEVLPNGFENFDELRKQVSLKLEACADNNKATPKNSKLKLESDIRRLKGQIQVMSEDLLRITNALHLSLKNGKNYARESNNESIIDNCRSEQKFILDSVSEYLDRWKDHPDS